MMISEQLYHVGKHQSRPIFEVKQHWAQVSTWMGDRLENNVKSIQIYIYVAVHVTRPVARTAAARRARAENLSRE